MGSTLPVKKINQYGLSEVYSAPEPQVDIVFVHGLNGHPHHTWATHKPEAFWPVDLLPQALQDQPCRILTYGYDATVGTFTDGTSKDELHNHAEHLASRLVANRSLSRASERPIIFVCHSLGGLVVKRCLIACKNVRHAHTERLRSIYVSTYGILFLGTPHNGSDIAKWGTLLESICSAVMPKKFFDSSPQLIEALKRNNVQLQNINRLFIEIISRFRVFFFHESKPMDLKGTKAIVVDEDSAAPVIEGVDRMGIERDHSHMCKFEDRNAPGYDVVAEAIQRYAMDAPNCIQVRWNEEKQIRLYERQSAARELLSDSMFQMSGGHMPEQSSARPSQTVSLGSHDKAFLLPLNQHGDLHQYEVKEFDEPAIKFCGLDSSVVSIRAIENGSGTSLLIAPLGFRPNSLFLGFQIELDQIHLKLDNKKRKLIGTCSVLVWGPAGCGKSHLARQYVWSHREDYPGGIFWVDSKSEESRCRSFWDIGQAAALLGASKPRDQDWDAASKFIDAVRKWLESRDRWLLVFDGVSFDSDDDIQRFMKFIPDRKGNSIIFTSVDSTLAKRQRLLNPLAVRVRPLSHEDARTLLYRSLGIREPNSFESAKATDLVKHCECLPLAIHAAAHALIAKGRSLEKYSPGSTSKRLAEPYLEITEALRERNHIEAINLIKLLSFFNHNVPVALLLLGRKALVEDGVEIRAIERKGSSRRELDNTIAVLIRYGLVERTLQPYQLNVSLSAETSLTPATTNGNSSPDIPRKSIEMESVAPNLAKGLLAKFEVEPDPTREITDDIRPESSLGGASAESVTYSIDILRVHTVVQDLFRDELRHKDPDHQEYHWWLAVAARLLSLSYREADNRIRGSVRQGLVRDYREYETQAARMWSHFPKKPRKVNNKLRKARHELHNILRAIKSEIESRSPTQSFNSSHRRVQVSIFERSSSTSSDGMETPNNLTRQSTWSFGEDSFRTKSESPTHMQLDIPLEAFDSDDSWDDRGYESGAYDSPRSSVITTRRSSKSDAADTTETLSPKDLNASRRPSFLQAIFGGKPVFGKNKKDLGEWRPEPAPPSLTPTDIQITPAAHAALSKASSGDERRSRAMTASSEAIAALAAVHRSSPPNSRGGRIRSPNRPRSQDSISNVSECERKPLAIRSPNLRLSPLAPEFNPLQTTSPPRSSHNSSKNHSRRPSQNPGVPPFDDNSSMSDLPRLPVQDDITISRRLPLDENMLYSQSISTRGGANNMARPQSHGFPEQGSRYKPTGYTSAPMSRDPSRESNFSLATAPAAVPGSASLSASPQLREPYVFRRPGPQSIDVVASNELQFGAMGGWTGAWTSGGFSPITPVGIGFGGGFDGEREKGQVQFGGMEPVVLAEARRRAVGDDRTGE